MLETAGQVKKRNYTWGYCDQNHAANSLIEASKENPTFDSILRCIVIDLVIVRTLKASLKGIQRVDKQVYSEGSKCAGLIESVEEPLTTSVPEDKTAMSCDAHKIESFQLNSTLARSQQSYVTCSNICLVACLCHEVMSLWHHTIYTKYENLQGEHPYAYSTFEIIVKKQKTCKSIL